jgi:asparagine synthase (glutamine-hydrolysing)
MCGILVTAGKNQEFHHRLLRTLKTRGPDQLGFWTDGRANLAHTRLSIIGLDERGVEPMFTDRYVLAYNGEIYNFLEIKERLLALGLPVQHSNDAEVLLYAWQEWGQNILKDLTGFWAFVIYDRVEKRLTLVRDQLGIKPLYYWIGKDFVCIASMISTLIDVAQSDRELDYEALSEYARYQFTFGDKTFIKQIKKVLPGQTVTIDLRDYSVRHQVYDDILHTEERVRLSPEWLQETKQLLKDCILDSTISDTSFTTFCSGGLDSSIITKIARPEVAYHCNFSDPDCNETFFAQRAVEGTGIRLFVVNAEEDLRLVDTLRTIVADFDELSIGSVILPLDNLLSQVKRRYKVILTGTGGDELFAGYVRYMLTMGDCNQDNYRALYAQVKQRQDPAERFELCHRKGNVELYNFYRPEVSQTFKQEFDRLHTDGNVLRTMLRFDQRFFLAGLLNIDDKMSGRHSLESRPSLLHQKLVRRMQAIEATPEVFLENGELKPLLRKMAKDILPEAIIHRRDKMGFTTPIGSFVNQSADNIREQITSSKYRSLYNLKRINFTAETKYSREVFGLLMLDLWLERYAAPLRPQLEIEKIVVKAQAEVRPPASPEPVSEPISVKPAVAQ